MKDRSQSFSTRTKRSKVVGGQSPKSSAWTVPRAIRELKLRGTKRNVEGMARFGIRAEKAFGVSKPEMDEIARKIGRNHALGLKLWKTGIRDARLLGMLISEAHKVTSSQMERWVRDFDSWDVCDGTCCHLFAHTEPAWDKAFACSSRRHEFEKRAGFALAAYLAIHDKNATDAPFRKYLKIIEKHACDNRHFVKKAVNWALRNIGKRNLRLNSQAIACAERIRRTATVPGRWIAADALRELRSEAVQARLLRKGE
jgi:3-methyladenine DNA glycosylase AlkD